MSNDHTTPDDKTREAEAAEARTDHDADDMPTQVEAEKADEVGGEVSDDVAENYEEQMERGAQVEGEGKIV